MTQSLYTQLAGAQLAAMFRKGTAIDKMKPALDAMDKLKNELAQAGVHIDVNKYLPYIENGETVIKPASGTRKGFVNVLIAAGFKRAVSAACYETYTRCSVIIRIYW